MTKKKVSLDVYGSKTAEKIRKLEEKRAELVEKRNAINSQIKKVDNELSVIKSQWQNEKISALLELGKKNGFSIDDLLNAAKDGDFLSLQDKIDEENTLVLDSAESESEETETAEESTDYASDTSDISDDSAEEFEDVDMTEEIADNSN